MTVETNPSYTWGSVLGEVIAVLLGIWIISQGRTGFGWTLVITGVIGLVASSLRLWRTMRQRSDKARL